jgi:two-component system copper resistance phosphate regulon response regulator CusR
MRILLVEDDSSIVEALTEKLGSHYIVDFATTGEKGLYKAQINPYDLIILDLNLPDTNGIALCRLIRANAVRSPILALTAEDNINTKVTMLDAGADDYLTKPFSGHELTARIRALLRRQSQTATVNRLEVDDLILDPVRRIAVRGKILLPLRRKEFDLLEYMVRNSNKTLRRETLLHHVWSDDSNSYSNLVDAHIKTLRDRVDKPFTKKLIRTVYGIGYCLDSSDEFETTTEQTDPRQPESS